MLRIAEWQHHQIVNCTLPCYVELLVSIRNSVLFTLQISIYIANSIEFVYLHYTLIIVVFRLNIYFQYNPSFKLGSDIFYLHSTCEAISWQWGYSMVTIFCKVVTNDYIALNAKGETTSITHFAYFLTSFLKPFWWYFH